VEGDYGDGVLAARPSLCGFPEGPVWSPRTPRSPSWRRARRFKSSDPDPRGREETIGWHREVGAGRSAANTPREIKTRRVTGTDPTLAGGRRLCARDQRQPAPQVRAEADHDQPLCMACLRAIGVACERAFRKGVVAGGAVRQILDSHAAGKAHFIACAVADGDRLSSPLDRCGRSWIDGSKLDVARLGQRCPCVGVTLIDERPERGSATDPSKRGRGLHNESSPRLRASAIFRHDGPRAVVPKPMCGGRRRESSGLP